MDSTDDDDSVNSIPRPIYEATSAIDSPPPDLWPTGQERDSVPIKRPKYVVSSPPNSANGSSSSNSSAWPVAAVTTGVHSLTMKLTKVTPTPTSTSTMVTQMETSSNKTLTPKQEVKVRVPKEMIALKRSHNESKVLTGFVSDSTEMKRRKSRAVAEHLIKQTVAGGLSTTLPTSTTEASAAIGAKATLKRSKSIHTPLWDSVEDVQPTSQMVSKPIRRRNYSVAYDDLSYEDEQRAEQSDGDENSSNQKRFRSRSKTVSLSSEERQPRRSNMRSETEEPEQQRNPCLHRGVNDALEILEQSPPGETEGEPDTGEWRTSSVVDSDPNLSMLSDATDDTRITSACDELLQRLDKIWQPPPRNGWDPFCWKCRECGSLMPCSKCLRCFHPYCVRPASTKFDSTWKCPECLLVESAPKRPRRNDVSVDMLSQLLIFALERMKLVRGVHKLRAPQKVLPDNYSKYFVNPVTFETLAERIKNHAFHNADEFLSEVKWMQHNALILDYGDTKADQASKAVVKICRQEANEIDTCAECYLNANSNDEWFVKVCTQPHLLLWAKLKGFPYWPAKAMGCGPNAVVNVRFFGKHDRANVPVKDCFLYSAQDPNTQTSRRSARDLAECIREVEIHIEHIRNKIGCFNYAPYRQPFDPQEEQKQLEQMMPGVHEVINRQLAPANKAPLQFLIRKTAGDKLSIVKKTKAAESGNESDQSLSPSKKAIQDADATVQLSTEHVKPKSSNYEVIPRTADALRESRGCTVVLKRKSLETCKAMSKMSMTAGDVLTTVKRKHSHSDASSEASHQGTSSEQKRRSKHARKAERIEKEDAQHCEEDAEKSKADIETNDATTSVVVEASPAVDSVVELVRRRQGVTITKIPRDQQQPHEHQMQQQHQQMLQQQQYEQLQQEQHEQLQQQQQLLERQEQRQQQQQHPEQQQQQQQLQHKQEQQQQQEQKLPNQTSLKSDEATSMDEAISRQRAVERQQQQLISKVIPFVEIKKEVVSEPEDNEESGNSATATEPMAVAEQEQQEEQKQQQQQQEEQEQEPQKLPTPQPIQENIQPAVAATIARAAVEVPPVESNPAVRIKEEVVSEEELEMDQNKTTMPNTTLSSREEQPAEMNISDPTSTQNVVLPSTDNFVRFVGDTTIQRLSQKQTIKYPDTATPSGKRGVQRGVPHGPLPASALSPISTPPPARASPTPSVSPNSCVSAPSSQRPTPQTSPKLQQPVTNQLRVKSDITMNETVQAPVPHLPVVSPTSSLLKSNMVVIPMEPRNTNDASGSNSSCNLGSASMMSIPVPPLRAVTKNTLQSTNAMTSIAAVPIPAPIAAPNAAFPNNSLPPPPLAGLTTATTTTIRPVSSGTESGGLLANALNGLPSDTIAVESTPTEPITPGLTTALSELLLRSGPPKLTMRPSGPLQSDGSNIYPAQAGPLSTKLKENAHKITDYFISVIEDTLTDLAGTEPNVLQARIAGLTLENERLKHHYERQLADMKRSTDLMISEMRKTMEQENKRMISELRQHSAMERMRAVEEAKKKQWCANCMREAQLYCCWNTSYCDYPCQQMHWQRHSSTCGQAATLQTQSQNQAQPQSQPQQQPPPQPQPQPQIPTQVEMSSRGKHKQVSSTISNPNQQLNRPSTGDGSNKKWRQQPMISLLRPPPPQPAAEVLKLPNNTFLRPVSLPSTLPAQNNSTIVTPVTLIAPITSPHLNNALMPGQRNTLNYGAKQPQSLPVQRYNIPLSITVSNNPQFGHITDQHQKHVAKSTSRSSNKGNSRARNVTNINNTINTMNNNNNNNSAQNMRHNPLNRGFQQ